MSCFLRSVANKNVVSGLFVALLSLFLQQLFELLSGNTGSHDDPHRVVIFVHLLLFFSLVLSADGNIFEVSYMHALYT